MIGFRDGFLVVLMKELGVKRKVTLWGNYVNYLCRYLVVNGRQGGWVWEFS